MKALQAQRIVDDSLRVNKLFQMFKFVLRGRKHTHIVNASVIWICARKETKVQYRSLEKLVTEGSHESMRKPSKGGCIMHHL